MKIYKILETWVMIVFEPEKTFTYIYLWTCLFIIFVSNIDIRFHVKSKLRSKFKQANLIDSTYF